MKIAIIVFSGTGNTLYVSELLSKALQNLGATVDTLTLGLKQKELEDVQQLRENIATYDLFGIAFPVLGLGAPANVLDFAMSLPLGKNNIFLFKSAADNHSVNNAASEEIEQILRAKGYDVFHDFLYLMPCNFMVSYPHALNLQMIDTATQKASRHAKELMEGKRSKLFISPFCHFIAKWVHYLESEYGRQRFGISLHATSSCLGCLTCVQNCPAGNITHEGKGLKFHERCLFCMRCIYQCPAHAIHAQNYNTFVIKEGYQLQAYLGSKEYNRVFITPKSKGFWKHFRDYFCEAKSYM